jgi:hypothetical protein
MSEEIHIHEHSSPIKTPGQLIAVVVLSFAVPIAVISVIAHLVTAGGHVEKGNPAMSEEAIAKRLKPVGEVVVDPNNRRRRLPLPLPSPRRRPCPPLLRQPRPKGTRERARRFTTRPARSATLRV